MGEFEIELKKIEAWIIDCKNFEQARFVELYYPVCKRCVSLEFDLSPRATVRFYFLRYFLFFLKQELFNNLTFGSCY